MVSLAHFLSDCNNGNRKSSFFLRPVSALLRSPGTLSAAKFRYFEKCQPQYHDQSCSIADKICGAGGVDACGYSRLQDADKAGCCGERQQGAGNFAAPTPAEKSRDRQQKQGGENE